LYAKTTASTILEISESHMLFTADRGVILASRIQLGDHLIMSN